MNDPRRFNLFRREADVPVRNGMFDRDELVERKVADVSYPMACSRRRATWIGMDGPISRSSVPGTASLRFAKPLRR
jgi:hypothetical protein